MDIEDLARRLVAETWTERYRFGLLESTLYRPARGRSSQSPNQKGRRVENRKAVLDRLSQLSIDVLTGLLSGALSIDAARAMIAKAGFSEALRVADSPDEMAEQIAAVIRDGDNVMISDGDKDWNFGSMGEGVLYLRFYRDRSHPRIV